MFRYLKAQPEDFLLRVLARIKALLLLFVVITLLSACGQSARAPISEKRIGAPTTKSTTYSNSKTRKRGAIPKSYTVVGGDTLQAIAWKFGLNHHEIARWNNIRNANLIYVGQRLRLSAPARRQKSSGSKKIDRVKPSSPKVKAAKAPSMKWQWPAAGKVSPASSSLGTKGIEIHGKRGSKVKAAAAGKVVYSGSGLRGYGNLVIIQHNNTYLSAYAHNEKILVPEGAIVRTGQAIASMGNSGTKQVMLHFEIRRNGKAVEPINYLPRR